MTTYSDTENRYRKHYNYNYNDIAYDPYMILTVYQVKDPGIQHAIKKLLRAGRSHKSYQQDVQECVVSLKRSLEILELTFEREIPHIITNEILGNKYYIPCSSIIELYEITENNDIVETVLDELLFYETIAEYHQRRYVLLTSIRRLEVLADR